MSQSQRSNILKTNFFIITALLMSFIASPIYAKGGSGNGGNFLPVLSNQEAADLQFLREEEKLARDVYLELYKIWGNQVFLNISGSEQRHMDSVKGLLDRYGIADPIDNDTLGVFVNSHLQHLYDGLTDFGYESEKNALYVGVDIENLDIYDIGLFLKDATQTDVKRVLTNLQAGSYNHLDAFNNALDLP